MGTAIRTGGAGALQWFGGSIAGGRAWRRVAWVGLCVIGIGLHGDTLAVKVTGAAAWWGVATGRTVMGSTANVVRDAGSLR